MQFDEVIKSDAALVGAIGPTPQRMLDKQIDFIDDICRSYIERAPFLAIASFDGHGRADVSPKGDAPGFVAILDEKTIAIPERPGNRRADTFRNVLQNPHVGLIFFIPGRGETLRVNGQALIVRDRWLRERLAANGKLPELALIVTVEEAFVHCTKCMNSLAVVAARYMGSGWPTIGR